MPSTQIRAMSRGIRPKPWGRLSPRVVIAAWLITLALALGFGFLGSRPIWEPDEGRYTNVALVMLESGNWLDPMRNQDIGHWTKPPMVYWALASSFGVLGSNPWAARVPIALAYLACMLLVWLIARQLARGAEALAAVVYVTMVLPSVAGQLVTTDFILSACETLAVFGFIHFRFGTSLRRDYGLLVMWLGFGLGFMTKGPPALIPLVPIALLQVLAPRPAATRWIWHVLGIVLFLVVAMPWYAAVVLKHEGLMGYFVGAEVVDRLATDRFGRHAEWYAWAEIYVPTILIGALPWTMSLLRWFRTLPEKIRRWWESAARSESAESLFLVLWALIPLLIFCAARSRLPLYILPVFAPFAIAIATTRISRGLGIPRSRWLVLWVAVLLGLRLASSVYPIDADTSAWARAIRERVKGPIEEVLFVEDNPRYGLHLYLDAEVELISREPTERERFNPAYDESLWDELQETGFETGVVYVTPETIWPDVERVIREHGYEAQALGAPYIGRIIFAVTVHTP